MNASYHDSEQKHENRKFKLAWGRKAIRHGRKVPREVLTLCGNSVWFEMQLAGYAQSIGAPILVTGFNTTLSEYVEAEKMLNNVAGDLPIVLHRAMMKPKNADLSSFVDFDTTSWFAKEGLAESALGFCNVAEMVAITVIIGGPRLGACDAMPEGTEINDMRSPEKIGAWLAERTPLHHLATHTYKNLGNAEKHQSPYTMATIIMGKKSLTVYKPAKLDHSAKTVAYGMLSNGYTVSEAATATGLPFGSVRAMKARLHPSFAKK